MKFEVQTHTMVDGWQNTWKEDDQPVQYNSEEEAIEAMQEHINDEEVIAMGYVPEQFRVKEVK